MATRVIIKGFDKFAKLESKTIEKLSRRQIADIAVDTATVIQRNIRESLQRPGSTGNLANSFFAEPIGKRGWGVGNISFLNQNAPYWRWINFGVAASGRKVPPTTTGQFTPGQGFPDSNSFRTGRFQHSVGTGGFTFKLVPKKAIEPHNFIQRTLFEIPRIISSALGRIKR